MGSGKTVVRYRKPDGSIQVRCTESFEYFRNIGWMDEQWKRVELSGVEQSEDFLELCANLVGNAWTAFHYIPLQLAGLATLGKFHRGSVVGTAGTSDDIDSEAEGSEGSSMSSSSD